MVTGADFRSHPVHILLLAPQVTAAHISKIGELVRESLESLEDTDATAQVKRHFQNTAAHVKALKAQGGRCAELEL